MKRIYLVGLMGSGKSTFGKKLAEALSWTFVDLDKQIEEGENKSISALFEQRGENRFRMLEKEYLRKSSSKLQSVIACGGGTPCFHGNMDWMLQHGKIIFLNPPLKTILKRILPEKSERPLLQKITDKNLEPFMRNMLEERYQYYVRAHYTLCSETPSEKEVINILLKK
jgi:shikimate kinase